MNHDVIVIGGSYAGMSAALQLLRARRSVLIIDGGRRRNRAASHSHGFLTHDGADPAELAARARAQLMRYPTLAWIDTDATRASGTRDAFEVACGNELHRGRRILIATGVRDVLPDVPGLAERWGRSVFHCPYCHGYELDRGPIGVIATSPLSLHQVQLVAEWGPTTFFLNGALEPDAAAFAVLAQRGITVDPTPVRSIEDVADVVLDDGRRTSFAGLFTAPRSEPASDIAAQLGCEIAEAPYGTQIATSETKETRVAGVFACGDVARAPHSLALAVGDGAWAGAQVHRSLVWPDTLLA